jgi:mRNA interferase MazF
MPADWVRNRQDLISIGYNPHAGLEMRDRHHFPVRWPRGFNASTSLVIGLPMTTIEHNADRPCAVATDGASGAEPGKVRYV